MGQQHEPITLCLFHAGVDYRMVFSLREINGLNIYETAEALEISEANVKVRLNRAKTMLRKEIEKSYSAEDIFEFNLIYCNAMVDIVMKKVAQLQQIIQENLKMKKQKPSL